jgi:hypothetical protein
MQVLDTFLDAMGNTPLVKLHAVTRGVRPTVVAKLEMLNPGGSVKDRIGIRMIEAAERAGLLRPGGTIVEPTSGNTGHGLAIAAAIRGYRCIFVMPDKMSQEKIALLRAYGAEVVITPTAVPKESPPRSPAPSNPTSTGTTRIPRPTTRQQGPSCGSRPAARSGTSWPASGPAARSPGSAATSRSATLRSRSSEPIPKVRSTPATIHART